MSPSPDDENKARDLLFASLADPAEGQKLAQQLQIHLTHTRFKIDYAQNGPEALPGIPSAFIDRFGTVTSSNTIDTPNSALLCGVVHGQKGGLNKRIAADRDLFCQFVTMQTKICDLWIALRNDYRTPPVRFVLEGLREKFFSTQFNRESLKIIDYKRREISEDGLGGANRMFDELGVNREKGLNAFDSWSLFFANCFLTNKVDLFKPGAPDIPSGERPINRARQEIKALSLQPTDPDDDEAMRLLQRWQQYYIRDYNVRHQYALGQTAPSGLTVLALGRSHLGSIPDNSSIPECSAESDFKVVRNCALDFHGAADLEYLIDEKLGKEFNPFTATPDDLREMLSKIRTG